MMRILVVGAGAVGGYFGGRLMQAGRDVTFLVRPKRADQLRRDGLQIISPLGDARLTPKLVTADAIDGPYDVILLSVKGFGLFSAIEDFAPAVGPDSMIVPLLNGMGHFGILAERFGRQAVVGGLCLVVTDVDERGRIIQMNSLQQMTYGELDGTVTPRLQALDATLRGAGFETTLSSDIRQSLWDKWVRLASLAAVTCLFRGPIGAVAAVPGGAALAQTVLDEIAAIATAWSCPPPPALLATHSEALTAKGSPATASMYRDLSKGLPVEVDSILGDLLGRGAAKGIDTPLLQAAFVSLRVYEDKRRSQPS